MSVSISYSKREKRRRILNHAIYQINTATSMSQVIDYIQINSIYKIKNSI